MAEPTFRVAEIAAALGAVSRVTAAWSSPVWQSRSRPGQITGAGDDARLWARPCTGCRPGGGGLAGGGLARAGPAGGDPCPPQPAGDGAADRADGPARSGRAGRASDGACGRRGADRAGVSVGAFTVIGAGADLADNVRIGPHVTVSEGVQIGAGSDLRAGARIGPRVRLGARAFWCR